MNVVSSKKDVADFCKPLKSLYAYSVKQSHAEVKDFSQSHQLLQTMESSEGKVETLDTLKNCLSSEQLTFRCSQTKRTAFEEPLAGLTLADILEK